jgi:hypothetical protein
VAAVGFEEALQRRQPVALAYKMHDGDFGHLRRPVLD